MTTCNYIKKRTMKKLLFCLAYFSMSLTQLLGQETISQNIYFPYDAFTLDEQSELQLREFINQLELYKEHDITIVGHTDQDGTNDYNLALSERRASTVSEFLQSNGIASDILEVSYMGEDQLLNHSNSTELKKKNRRVSIVAMAYNYENVDQFLQLLDSDNSNHHRINANEETELTLKKGTEVLIPANAFCLEDGTPVDNKNVTLTINEAYSYTDMIDHQLSTQTEDKILETGGMIYIGATKDGQKLQLQKGKSIELSYPIQKPKDGMELFLPVSDAGENEGQNVTWQATGQAVETVEVNTDEQFIQIDLDPLLNYPFTELEKPSLIFEEMPKFPRPVKEPFPPSKKIYSEKKYQEVYKKYELAKAKYEKDQKSYSSRLASWTKEAQERKKLIASHKYNLNVYHTQRRVEYALTQLADRQATESHDKLLPEIFGFLDKAMPPIPFDEKHYIKLAFQDVGRDVKDQMGLTIFPSSNMIIRTERYCLDFNFIVDAKVQEAKTGVYYGDALNSKRASRYLFSTSNLGWINCDRFYNVSPQDRTNLTIANVENGVKCFMIFKNIKSVLSPRGGKEKKFSNIPKGHAVSLIALKFVNDQVFLGTKEMTTGSIDKMEFEYEQTTLHKLKEIIKSIASE